MTGLMAALGAQNMPQGGDGSGRGGPGGENVPAPFLNLFQSLGLIPGGGQMGDFVYSQEGLDRIVSQLMEQTTTNNAPPPATQADIDALPRKKVDESMLGPEHTAECSICMDEVNIGEEVTELPCKHWFHHTCVSAWLLEHDTCPHCRKGITKAPEGEANAQASASSAQANASTQPSGLAHSTTYLAPAHHQIHMSSPLIPDLPMTRPPGLPPLWKRLQVESVTGYAGVGSLALNPEIYIALDI
jgi:E3 ubiquitin-protein ligase RNF115/126